MVRIAAVAALAASFACVAPGVAAARNGPGEIGDGFVLGEATIPQIQAALQSHQITVTDLVEGYLSRIKAYNGTCVNQPQGVLGPITMIPDAGKVNALITLNLRPANRLAWGFDDRKARSMTDATDNNAAMPDALETAAAQDAEFARTGKLLPLQGVVMSIKDQYDTFDMRSTSGGDAAWANDRPPADSTVVERLRKAGAIILAKANLDEYAGGAARSSFGGTECNPYDTTRDPGGSSGGSATSVSMNFVTCAIGEETGGSIVKPSSFNDVVGVVPTRELVSAAGMIQRGLNTRVGPICRTVADAARILQAYKGWDPKDELTSFGDGRSPDSFDTTTKTTLAGMRIGVIREYMDKALFNAVDTQNIDITNAAIDQLRALGATIVDPGEHGALFQSCVDKYLPKWQNQQFVRGFPTLFPTDPTTGLPTTDQLQTLLDMYFDPSKVPHTATGRPSIRSFGGTGSDAGEAKFNFNQYIHDRGDAKIHNLTELIANSQFWTDPNPAMGNRRSGLVSTDRATTLATASATQTRFAVQTVVSTCFAHNDLDAVVFPTGNVPPGVLTSPEEPSLNDRGIVWSGLSAYGFPAMTIPSGFTTQVYDRDASGVLLPPKPAALPVGVQLLGLPFNEQKLITIGAAYQAASQKRVPPPAFPPVPQTAITAVTASVGGTVPATLGLSVTSGSFGAFAPGVAKDYTASSTATVVSTAGDAALSYSDPGHLTNGAFSLPSALEVTLSKATWTAAVSNDAVTVGFKQHVAAGDALRTGSYSKTLTFTLSTTTP
ncbi:amidase [Solirubrobacter ginsenosidimutans]|uniref:Amidase n=1 Tax=Solirubrobacter ginsenosidimutans TaxID=490573 RepID=A0A9X3N4R3_9ACTN|nr:amidase [Solirubrobacter ginsenosidimutans]MDA0167231.1 amidase [Solirubrobacter ginsenosidimutans]